MHFEKLNNLSIPKTKSNQTKKRKSNSADKTKQKKPTKIKYTIPLLRKKTVSLKRKQENANNISLQNPLLIISSENSNKFQKQIKTELPWVTKITEQAEKGLKFHYEIFDFLKFISPTQAENNKRLRTFFLLQSLLNKRWPTWKVQVYGSFLVNLHLKDSDVDFTVLNSRNLNFSTGNFSDYDDISDWQMLNYIYEFLVESKFSSEENTHLISAKVPIIKCVCEETGVNVDLSVNQQNGIKAAQIMSQLMLAYPIIRPTVMILKYILRQKDLNEPFTGGIGSFVIFNMVYAYILFLIRIKKIPFISKSNLDTDAAQELSQLSDSKFFSSKEMRSIEDLGTFFYGFLNFYGFEFDFRNYGISNFGIGSFFRKNNSRFFHMSEKLCILNILDPTQDICRSAYNYDRIVGLFRDLVFRIFRFDQFLFGAYDKCNAASEENCFDTDVESDYCKSPKSANKNKNDQPFGCFKNKNPDFCFDSGMEYDNISYIDKLIFYDNYSDN